MGEPLLVESGNTLPTFIKDTVGQDRFRTITSSYYRGAQGIILVYDIFNRDSFDALSRWYSELETYYYISHKVVKILVGNKVDKEFLRQVPTVEAQAFATRMNSLFIDASAKTAVGVKDAFSDVVERILDIPELWDAAPGVSIGKTAGRNVILADENEQEGAAGALVGPRVRPQTALKTRHDPYTTVSSPHYTHAYLMYIPST
ncbi:ras family-domain-containing protein [Mycena rosella]|uniref:Ras family-domain-containing protein n=1 Tax=Mycena rosella TaxID=1033263 RepID=A0AAD7D2F4_MYCRO|nr:ras family-domain-containing protein [Mycena rosella]